MKAPQQGGDGGEQFGRTQVGGQRLVALAVEAQRLRSAVEPVYVQEPVDRGRRRGGRSVHEVAVA